MINANPQDAIPDRPPIQIRELEGVTILSARLTLDAEGKDALVIDGDDGTNVVIHICQPKGEDAFLEVRGENVLTSAEADPFVD